MCNHYRLDARDIQMFKDWKDIGLPPLYLEMQSDVWPKRPGLVARIAVADKMSRLTISKRHYRDCRN